MGMWVVFKACHFVKDKKSYSVPFLYVRTIKRNHRILELEVAIPLVM